MSKLLRPRHDGKAMYFPCIDDYFSDYNDRRREELGQPFGPSLAGGGLAFLLEGTQIAACMQVAAGCIISQTTEFYLVSHEDCGAYTYFAGINWEQHDYDAQIATLWRDLHMAEQIVREYLSNFDHPQDTHWKVPALRFHLEVINLQEESVPEPQSLDKALEFEHYNGIRIPRD